MLCYGKVVANAKHYVLNNQETNRGAVIEDVDERTRFEMYVARLINCAALCRNDASCANVATGTTRRSPARRRPT
jgi:hypothetical protein